MSICIPTLDGWLSGEPSRLEVLLTTISAYTPLDHEVIVVGSGNRVRGFPFGMNQAMRAARGRVIIGLNDDVEVTPGWCEPLVAAIDAGAWVASPDQTSTDGNQCICGWCVAFSRTALWCEDLWYDEQFGIWCTDIDLCKRLAAAGHPPVRVAIPVPLKHALNATTSRREVQDVINDEAVADLDRYEAKWGSRAETDKHALAP